MLSLLCIPRLLFPLAFLRLTTPFRLFLLSALPFDFFLMPSLVRAALSFGFLRVRSLQRCQHRPEVGVPVFQILLDALLQQFAQPGCECPKMAAARLGGPEQSVATHLAERINVRVRPHQNTSPLAVEHLPHLLRRGVFHGPGHAAAQDSVLARGPCHARLDRLTPQGQSEVDHLDQPAVALFADQHVFRLQVAVKDTRLVRRFHGPGDFAGQPDHVGGCNRAAFPDECLQGSAGKIVHDDVRPCFRTAIGVIAIAYSDDRHVR